MHVYIGCILLIVVILLSILLLFGFPLGELTMGGKYKVWPKNLRIIALGQLLVQIFALYILLSSKEILIIFITRNVTKIVCYVFSVFFIFNTILNILSRSKKEKYIMTPLSAIEAVCFFVAGIQM